MIQINRKHIIPTSNKQWVLLLLLICLMTFYLNLSMPLQEEVLVFKHGYYNILIEHADSDEKLNEFDKQSLLLLAHGECVLTPRRH